MLTYFKTSFAAS